MQTIVYISIIEYNYLMIKYNVTEKLIVIV